jgi:hypothetical protein
MEDLLATLPDGLVELSILLDVAFFLLIGKAAGGKGQPDASK